MDLSQEFVLKVQEISHSRPKLIELMNALDEEKRSIRSHMREWSNQPKDAGGLAGPERYRKLRRLKDRMAFLIEEREYVRQKLGDLKADQKALRSNTNNRQVGFSHAFLAAAQRTLDPETFEKLELKAAQILMQEP